MNTPKPLRSLTLIAEVGAAVIELQGGEFDSKLQGDIEAKVKSRYQDLGFHTLQEYSVYFETHEEEELAELVERSTTQPGSFFREFVHFEMLPQVLSEILPIAKARDSKELKIWSVGCGKGQEAISIDLYLRHQLSALAPELGLSILATDPKQSNIEAALEGFYPRSEVRDIPREYLNEEWTRAIKSHVEGMKFKSGHPSVITYKKGEAVQIANQLKSEGKGSKFDLIFCRNLLGRLNESEIRETVTKLIALLHPHGRLFLGLKESIVGMDLPVVEVGPATYRLAVQKGNSPTTASTPARAVTSPENIQVYGVIDSPAVLTLIKQMIKPEWSLEITGVSASFEEAVTKFEDIKKSDLLIIHLNSSVPEWLNCLKREFPTNHPPLIFLSQELAQIPEGLGALIQSAPIEIMDSPVLNQLSAQGDSLRAKIRTLIYHRDSRARQAKVYDQFKKCSMVTRPEQKVRILFAGVSDIPKVSEYLRELPGVQPPHYLFFDSVESSLERIALELRLASSKACLPILDLSEKLGVGQISVLDPKRNFTKVANFHSGDVASIAVMGEISTAGSQLILKWPGPQLILEDLGLGHGTELLDRHSSEVYATSSFAYLSSEYLEKK